MVYSYKSFLKEKYNKIKNHFTFIYMRIININKIYKGNLY